MRRTPRARPRRRSVALLVVLGLVLTACGPSDEELRAQRLREAVDTTFASPFAFDLSLDVDEAALVDLEEAAGPLATLLASLELDGVVDDDRIAVSLDVLDLDALELRIVGADELYVRSDLSGLVALLGEPTEVTRAVERALRSAGTPTDVIAAAIVVVRGDWVRLQTVEDDGGADAPALGGVLEGLLQAATVTDHLGRLEGDDAFDGQLTVAVDLGDARAAIAGVLAGLEVVGTPAPLDDADAASTVRGRVLVTGGRIRSVDLDLGTALAAANGRAAGGDLTLRLELSQHGEVDAVGAPEDAVPLTVADLEAAIAAIGQALGPDAIGGLTGQDAP